MSTKPGRSNILVNTGPSLSYNGTSMEAAALFNYFGVYCLKPDGNVELILGVEVILHWCLNTYEVRIENNVLNLTAVLSHTEIQAEEVNSSTAVERFPEQYLITPMEKNARYLFGSTGVEELRGLLNYSLAGFSVDTGENLISSGSDMLMQGVDEMECEHKDKNSTMWWWDAVSSMARNVGTGLTNS
ncbi:hypothetical protein CCHR01_18289 [Colletotrichum chrysophilum]|uniref:Uncharacterized protein n=2 Tax=Colletotrichum chrysophilum TaxID=1836956 RepID=A0AAD9A0D7_9PEZI|nr:hypothetical protein CCHR01_18289 [Colletotrichum chrysophilum]